MNFETFFCRFKQVTGRRCKKLIEVLFLGEIAFPPVPTAFDAHWVRIAVTGLRGTCKYSYNSKEACNISKTKNMVMK